MFSWVLIFLVVALIAALLGFGGVAASAAGIAQSIFLIAIGLVAITAVITLVRRPRADAPRLS